MPPGPWHFPEDQVADLNLRFLAAEITREKIYERLHEELPYSSTVETETWEEIKDGSVKISQAIFVARDGQKAIVLGKGGQMIRQIGPAGRKELERELGTKVHLDLTVRVRRGWRADESLLDRLGFDN
jgi:GTP-binding protein Era